MSSTLGMRLSDTSSRSSKGTERWREGGREVTRFEAMCNSVRLGREQMERDADRWLRWAVRETRLWEVVLPALEWGKFVFRSSRSPPHLGGRLYSRVSRWLSDTHNSESLLIPPKHFGKLEPKSLPAIFTDSSCDEEAIKTATAVLATSKTNRRGIRSASPIFLTSTSMFKPLTVSFVRQFPPTAS